MESKKNNILLFIVYVVILIGIFISMFTLIQVSNVKSFVEKIENSTFDLRQQIISGYKKVNNDIVILAIDDETYEYIMDKYGQWPISREVWGKLINNIEKVNPKNIVFDLLFFKPNLQDKKGDRELISAVKNNDNVFLSMNFDRYSEEIRKSANFDDKLKLKITSGELKDSDYITFTNSRSVMKELENVTNNIGVINVIRDEDGIIRESIPVSKYKNAYYPNLSLLVAMKMLDISSISLNSDKITLDGNHIIPLDETQRCILNWYGKAKSYPHISVWKAIKAIKENDTKFLKNNFENKIVYIGATVTSLSDLKSVPVESNMAGVELHTTFLNNVLDNNFIKKVDNHFNFLIAILLSALIGYLVLKVKSVTKTLIALFSLTFLYTVLSLYLMAKYNLWIAYVMPVSMMYITFMVVYCEKYLLKTKDYEQTYQLAVTDGLTGLYNHRYFQEQMTIQVDNYKRYRHSFSIIMIDIDYFKKFNDTYGHQSGDCVLKQVAQILSKNSRSSDFACRYGGEEMTLILTNTYKKEAIMVANKICQTVRDTKFILANNEMVNVTISVGVATVGENGYNPQEIIEYSDKCLYFAKENGRNQVVYQV